MQRLVVIIIWLFLPVAAFAQTGGTAAPCANAAAVDCHIVLNSHTSNPKYGNEAQFLAVANNATGVFHTSGVVRDGETLMLRVYIDNNTNPKRVADSTAKNVHVQIGMPAQSTSNQAKLTGTITAPNAMPQTLSSSLTLSASQPFTLTAVPNTAVDHWADGSNPRTTAKSNDNLFGNGTTIDQVMAGYHDSVDTTVLVQVHFTPTAGGAVAPTGGAPRSQTGGTSAVAVTTAPAATPATVNVVQVQGQDQTQSQGSTGAGGAAPAAQTQSQNPGQGQNQAVAYDSTSNDSAVQSANGQAQNQSQSQSQAATTLPDTGTTSATSGTLGLTLLLIVAAAYYRSRQGLNRRLRRQS